MSLNVATPDKLNFSVPAGWPQCRKRFERHMAVGLWFGKLSGDGQNRHPLIYYGGGIRANTVQCNQTPGTWWYAILF